MVSATLGRVSSRLSTKVQRVHVGAFCRTHAARAMLLMSMATTLRPQPSANPVVDVMAGPMEQRMLNRRVICLRALRHAVMICGGAPKCRHICRNFTRQVIEALDDVHHTSRDWGAFIVVCLNEGLDVPADLCCISAWQISKTR